MGIDKIQDRVVPLTEDVPYTDAEGELYDDRSYCVNRVGTDGIFFDDATKLNREVSRFRYVWCERKEPSIILEK